MKRFALFVLGLCLAVPVLANPTGAPLLFFPLEPCRVVDTRVSLGPVPAYPLGGLGIFVRGSNLLASDGAAQTDCGVPLAAEAVSINLVAVGPTSAGSLRVNAVGFVYGPQGAYSRLNFAFGQNVANEMIVSLCNVFVYPFPHAPCPWDDEGHYMDIAVLADMSVGASVHVVADVVGYWARGD